MASRNGIIGIGDEQTELLSAATKFCADKSPVETVRRLIDDELGFDPGVFAEMARLGWLGISIPEQYDGAGLELAEVVPVFEQMGRRLMAGPLLATTLAAQTLLAAGTETQRSEVLPKIATGSVATVALSEPAASWDPTEIQCRAERSGDRIILHGTKCLVLDAHVAEWIVVSVLLDGAPALVLLDSRAIAACESRREVVIDETRRSFRLRLDRVSVDSAALLESKAAVSALERATLTGALLTAAEMCGAGTSCVDYTLAYLNSRKQFGRAIGSYQALKHTAVDAHVGVEQARSHLWAAAHAFENGTEGEIAVRMAKADAGPALAFAADRAIQFHGGYGFTYECDAQLYRRRALWGESQFGDALYQRQRLADLLL